MQVQTVSRSRTAVPQYIAHARKKAKPSRAKAAKPRRSPIEIAIAEYSAAKRLETIAKRAFEAKCDEYPELEEAGPLVYMFTNGDGKKLFGRTIDDFNVYCPPDLDYVCTRNPVARARFVDALKEAGEQHRQRRREVGVTELDNLAARARGRRTRLFHDIAKFKPKTARDVAVLSRFLLKNLPAEYGGSIWPEIMPNAAEHARIEARCFWAMRTVKKVLIGLSSIGSI